MTDMEHTKERQIQTPVNDRKVHKRILASWKDPELEETQIPAFGSSDSVQEHSLANKKLTDPRRQDMVYVRNRCSRYGVKVRISRGESSKRKSFMRKMKLEFGREVTLHEASLTSLTRQSVPAPRSEQKELSALRQTGRPEPVGAAAGP